MRNLNVVVLALLAAPLLGGCYARARGSAYVYAPAPRVYAPPPQPVYVAPAPPPQQVVYQDDVVYVAPPPSIESYPYVVYNGQPHYYVQGRWYRRHQSGSWVVYNSEPGYLATERGRRGWTVTTYGGTTYGPQPTYGGSTSVGPAPYVPPAQPAYRPGYTTTVTTAPPAYGGGGTVYVGGSSAPPATRVTTASPAH